MDINFQPMSDSSFFGGGSQPPPPTPLNLFGGGSQPPPPLNLFGGGSQLPPSFNFTGELAFDPPASLNLSMKLGLNSGSSENFKAFMKAQQLSKEEGTAIDPNFTTSPSLNFEQKEEWEIERRESEEKARIAGELGIDLNTNKKIRFAPEKPIPYFYSPESSSGGTSGGASSGGGGEE